MRQFIKHRIIEIIGILINIILISRYLFDKITIRCEPCLNPNDCPPCQTDYMENFGVYMIAFNILFAAGIIIKMKKWQNENS